MSNELKDRIGRVVKVGDHIAWSGAGSGVDISIVTKIHAKTVRGNCGGLILTKYAIVVNEQLDTTSEGEAIKASLHDRYKDQFDYTPPKR